MAGRNLALPLDVEEVGPLLRCVLRLHLGGVVGEHDEAGRRRVIVAVRIEIAELRQDFRCRLRNVLLEPSFGLQPHVVADVGR